MMAPATASATVTVRNLTESIGMIYGATAVARLPQGYHVDDRWQAITKPEPLKLPMFMGFW